jgi:hypothetical protein
LKGLKRKIAIDKATTDEITAIAEIAYNILEGNFEISKEAKEKLLRHKTVIRELAQKNISNRRKKKLISNQCRILPHLLGPVLTALGTVAGRVISSTLGY